MIMQSNICFVQFSQTKSLFLIFIFLLFRHVALTQKEDRINIAMISNDNAFLNTYQNVPSPFMQRTLLTRLGDPDYDPIMIPKPIFHLWTLFSLQGIVFSFFLSSFEMVLVFKYYCLSNE